MQKRQTKRQNKKARQNSTTKLSAKKGGSAIAHVLRPLYHHVGRLPRLLDRRRDRAVRGRECASLVLVRGIS